MKISKVYCVDGEIPKKCIDCSCHKFVALVNGNYNYKCLLDNSVSELGFDDLKTRCPMRPYSDIVKAVVLLAKSKEVK